MATTSSTATTGSGTGSTTSSSSSTGVGGAMSSSGSVAPRCSSGLCDTTNDGALCSVRTPGDAAPEALVYLIAGAIVVGSWRYLNRRLSR